MHPIGLFFRTIVSITLFSAVAAIAQLPDYTAAGPVPPAIRSAQKIFIANAGADSGLFPKPFTGDPNRAYTQFYAALNATGHYKIADDPSDADLVLEIQLIAPNGPTEGSKALGAADPLPFFRLTIYDRKSHYLLWSITESIGAATGQKNHDRNFDNSLLGLIAKFDYLTGKQTPAH